jgi:acetyl-CoA carboxylase biotin carboxyl carrier protein
MGFPGLVFIKQVKTTDTGNEAPKEGGFVMNIEDIKGLLQAMHNNEITELELDKEGFHLHVKKGTSSVPLKAPEDKKPSPVLMEEKAVVMEDNDNTVVITAPMVGTFYRAPAPDAPPYVKVGDDIERGQPLCIIEAMKLMNEIESDVGGTIKGVLVENAQPVEFGQPLFVVEKRN